MLPPLRQAVEAIYSAWDAGSGQGMSIAET